MRAASAAALGNRQATWEKLLLERLQQVNGNSIVSPFEEHLPLELDNALLFRRPEGPNESLR